MELQGIDVSSHQGIIDWEKVKANGINFALIRASYGTKSVDSYFKRNAEECTRLNIPFGAYLYSYARNKEEAKLEVQNFINAIKPYKLSYPAIIDMEDADSYKSKNGVPYSTCIDICEIECKALEEAGYYAMIYANLDWLRNKINSSRLDRFDKWVAQWNNSCSYDKVYGIWQYTSKGKVAGINGNVDMNKSYKDYPSIIAGMKTTPEVITPRKSTEELANEVIAGKWGNGEERKNRLTEAGYDYSVIQARVNAIKGVKITPEVITYIVKRGDTLSSIAKKYNTTWKAIYDKNKNVIGNNPDLIRIGQKLIIP